MTTEQLNARTKKDLIVQARQLGILKAKNMPKETLVQAMVKAMQASAAPEKPSAAPKKPAPASAAKSTSPRPAPSAARKVTAPPSRPPMARSVARDGDPLPSGQTSAQRGKTEAPTGATNGSPTRDLSGNAPRDLPNGFTKDRILIMVRDPYWLHVYWELTHQAVGRAEAALGMDWHGAKPVLRLYDVSAPDTTSTAEAPLKDIPIHGGCNNWYIEVPQPPRSYRVAIGYVSKRGQFFILAHSNIVTTPRAGVSDSMDENWADIDSKSADRIFAMSNGFDPNHTGSRELRELFEERLRRPMSSPTIVGSSGSMIGGFARRFHFEIDAELIVYGKTDPAARVTLQGEPIKLRPDGTFTQRYSLPDSRQIIPAVAASVDGVEERTIVLAIERNTKVLEPMIHDAQAE